jgi:glucosamine-6-phosphate deaminase
MIQPQKEFTAEKLRVKIYDDRQQMGSSTAEDTAREIKALLGKKEYINMIFAAAPSQNEFLHSLSRQPGIDWSRVNAFHMDEYVGLSGDAPESFAHYLRQSLFDKVPFHEVFLFKGNAANAEEECRRYAELLNQHPVDIVCMGIGENGHLAFNDPHVANFNDPLAVKVVDLDDVSRQQQVHDGCFGHIDEVPSSALTLTVPALLRAGSLYCVVPGVNKAVAVFHTVHSEVTEGCPSTILRTHRNATLYLDRSSAAKLT